jgi:hypothetical protein
VKERGGALRGKGRFDAKQNIKRKGYRNALPFSLRDDDEQRDGEHPSHGALVPPVLGWWRSQQQQQPPRRFSLSKANAKKKET